MNFFIIFWNSERESVTTSESKNQVEGWFLLNVVVRESSAIFKLLTSEDETLLVWRDTFFVLDLSLNIFNCISRLNFKSDCFTSQGLDEDLHTTSKSKNQVEGWFFLNIVVRKCSSIFKLLSSENETLLIWRNTFFILNFSFDVLNSVCWLDLKGDGLTSESLDEDLHATSESKNQVEGWFLLNVVVRESSSIFKLLSSKNETLLVWRDTFFVLDLSLNIFNSICRLNFKGDCFTSEGLDENLHFSFWLGV